MAYDDIAFCRRPDGKLWLLGAGTHGKARPHTRCCSMRVLGSQNQGIACTHHSTSGHLSRSDPAAGDL